MMETQTFVEDISYPVSNYENVEWLLQQLLQRHGLMQIATHDGKQAAAETVLDLNMDGFHYTLTRTLTAATSEKYRLSPREFEIVQLVAKGLPNKTIANKLSISPCTVATHIRRIFDKLNAKSRAEMVARVMGYKV